MPTQKHRAGKWVVNTATLICYACYEPVLFYDRINGLDTKAVKQIRCKRCNVLNLIAKVPGVE